MTEARAPQRMLVVEDHADTRDLLELFFIRHGYDVTTVATADEGLALLRSQSFDIVLSDNDLEGGPQGAWMLREAHAAGLLESIGALMYTGDDQPEVPPSVRVLRKPTPLEQIERAVEEAVAAVRESRPPPCPPPPSGPHAELVLYVTSSPSSLRALKNLERVLARFDAGRVALRTCDLSSDGASPDAEADHIAFVPTLVLRGSGMRERLVGDLAEHAPLERMLLSCGVQSNDERSRQDQDGGHGSRHSHATAESRRVGRRSSRAGAAPARASSRCRSRAASRAAG